MRNLALHRLLGLALLTLVPVSAHAQQAAQAAPLRGDVNGDGRVSAADAQAVRDHVAGRPAAPGIVLLPNGDANGDGRITGVDAAMIQAFAAGRDVSRFGVGQPIRGGGGGEQKKNDNLLGLHVCTMDVETNTHSCETPRPQMGASADYLLGKPNVAYVTTGAASSRGNAADEDTTSMNVAVTNNIGQPIGTVDGTTAAASGVRVFFHDGPRVTSVKSGTLASATIRLEGTDGTADFAGPEGEFAKTNKPYYQYNGVLATGATSAPKGWKFVYSANTKTFTYSVQVSAPVQYEFGLITVAPASLVLGEAEASSALTPTVRNPLFAVVDEAVTWSSSNTAVATVDASGVVTGVAQGTATITATSQVKAQRKGSIPVTVDKAPTVVSTVPADEAKQVAGTSNIEITFSEAVDVTTSSFTLECPTGTAKTFTVSGSGTATVTLDPDADLPAGTICTVKVIGAQVSDSDTNDGPNHLAGDRTFSFEVNIQAVADAFGTTTTGNVRINSASTSPAFSVTANDQLNPANTTITFAGWNAVAGKTQQGGDVVMTTTGEGMGQFTYNPPAGFEGTDSLEYTITSGSASASAKVALPVGGMIWFVNNGGAACTTRADGCGRLTNPYSTLAAFQAENNGTGNNPAANEAVFIYQSTTSYAGPVTLLAGQKLIGQDATATLQALSGITPATGSDALPAMDAAGAAVTLAGADGVNLGTGNMLRGLTLAPTAGEAIGGTGFGTLTLSTGTPDLVVNAGGQALSLTTGAITGTFTSVASSGGTYNVLLSGVTGDIDFGAGALSGSTAGAIKIVGGPLTLDASGNITQAIAAPLLDVSGTHTGTLTFTGTLNATTGTGLQFSDADGVYSFAGTTTLNGGDAGIDIIGGSGGTFTFASGTGVTNPSGAAFRVASSTPAVTFNGNLTKSGTSTGLLVDISDQSSGTITFANGTLQGTSTSTLSTGIQLSNVDGTVAFNGTTTLSGGDNGIDVIGGSSGTVTFSANTSITNPSGNVVQIANSAPTFTYSGSFTKTGVNAGILVNANTGGTVTFEGAGKTRTLNTNTGHGVSLTGNSNTTVDFKDGGLVITSTSGNGFNATSNSGSGTVSVRGTGNTITSTTSGTALNFQNTTIGASGLTFQAISAGNSNGDPDPANGIVLNNTGTTAGLTVTGTGTTAGSGGTIQNTSGDGIRLHSTQNTSLSYMNVNNAASTAGATCTIQSASDCSASLDMVSATGVTLTGLVLNGSGQQGISGHNVTGLTIKSSQVLNAGNGNDEFGMLFSNLAGTVLLQDVTIDETEEGGIRLYNNTGSLNMTVLRGIISDNDPLSGNGEDGFQMEIEGSATARILVDDVDFLRTHRDGIDAIVEGTSGAQLNLTAQNNSFLVSNGSGGVTVAVNNTANANVTVHNNLIENTVSNAINVVTGVEATANLRITNNTIRHPAPPAAQIGFGIRLSQEEESDMTALVSGNNISGTGYDPIRAFSRYGDLDTSPGTGAGDYGTLHLSLRGNTAGAPLNPAYGIDIQAQNEENLVCLDIGFAGSAANNSSLGTGGALGLRVRKQNTSSGTGTGVVGFQIEGMPTGAQSIATTQNHIYTYNPAYSSATPATQVLASTSPSGGTFDGVGAGTCRDAATTLLP